MKVSKIFDRLPSNPCRPAREWVKRNQDLSPRELWEMCPYAEWLDWLALEVIGFGLCSVSELSVRMDSAISSCIGINDGWNSRNPIPDMEKAQIYRDHVPWHIIADGLTVIVNRKGRWDW